MTDDATLRQALAYARRGWPVFPCLEGQKVPATRHGYKDASTDPEQISGWFTRQPEGNRNAGLYWAANRALETDSAADLSPLADAARQAGLGDQEISRTLDSARRTGQAHPEPPDHQAEAVT